jgi:signal transduction histidine kinase
MARAMAGTACRRRRSPRGAVAAANTCPAPSLADPTTLAALPRHGHHPEMSAASPAPGSDLATGPAVLDRVNLERWHRAVAAAVDRKWARSRSLAFFTIYVAWAGFCVALWRQGFPPWRVGALLATLLLLAGTHLRALAVCDPRFLPEGESRFPFVLVLLATGLTGGLHSPLLLGVVGNLSGVLLRHGWTRATRAVLAVMVGGALAMAIVPEAWLGPRIVDPTYTITVLVVLVISVGVNTDYMIMAMTTGFAAIRQLLRARDNTASQALARAEELERMSSHLSHELKNPLGAIKALVQLSARAEQDPEIRVRLEVVEGEVERIQSIIEGYLSFSRPLDDLRPEAIALGPLADEVTAILEARAEEACVTLRRTGDARLTGDPRRLKEALLNLVANAIEATPRDGSVELRIAARGGAAEIAVADSGRGMPPDVLARLGTPFFTTREKGTGLGVLLARGVFVQHGGTLEYASTPGRGTVATGTLPLHPCEKASDVARTVGG